MICVLLEFSSHPYLATQWIEDATTHDPIVKVRIGIRMLQANLGLRFLNLFLSVMRDRATLTLVGHLYVGGLIQLFVQTCYSLDFFSVI